MRGGRFTDRGHFAAAIDRVAPKFTAEWRELSAKRPFRGGEIAGFLLRWRLLRPGLEWLIEELREDSLTGDSLGLFAISDEEIPTHNILPLEWQPGETGESAGEFRARVRRDLDAYVAAVESWMRENEIELPREQRSGGRLPRGAGRWDLLARHLVLGESYQDIADRYDVSWATIGEHVRDLANRLGIAL
jgi:hypothetical protein